VRKKVLSSLDKPILTHSSHHCWTILTMSLPFWAGRCNYLETYGGVGQLSDFIKSVFICVMKMNESLKGLEQHEG